MRSTKKVIVLFCIILSNLLNYKISYAYKDFDLFEEILQESKGQVVEYGVKTYFESNINGQELIDIVKNKINANKDTKSEVYSDKQNHHVHFVSKDTEGNITIINTEDSSLITIEIIQKGYKNDLEDLTEYVESIANYISDDKKIYYKYLKAQISYGNLQELNKKVTGLLKRIGATNINSIKLDNGFSTIAYTHRYSPKRNNRELMDFNFALCNYSTGNYIIIGTPEIIVSY